MVRPRRADQTVASAQLQSHTPEYDVRFAEVLRLIETARGRAYQAVNTELVTLYWSLRGARIQCAKHVEAHETGLMVVRLTSATASFA